MLLKLFGEKNKNDKRQRALSIQHGALKSKECQEQLMGMKFDLEICLWNGNATFPKKWESSLKKLVIWGFLCIQVCKTMMLDADESCITLCYEAHFFKRHCSLVSWFLTHSLRAKVCLRFKMHICWEVQKKVKSLRNKANFSCQPLRALLKFAAKIYRQKYQRSKISIWLDYNICCKFKMSWKGIFRCDKFIFLFSNISNLHKICFKIRILGQAFGART